MTCVFTRMAAFMMSCCRCCCKLLRTCAANLCSNYARESHCCTCRSHRHTEISMSMRTFQCFACTQMRHQCCSCSSAHRLSAVIGHTVRAAQIPILSRCCASHCRYKDPRCKRDLVAACAHWRIQAQAVIHMTPEVFVTVSSSSDSLVFAHCSSDDREGVHVHVP